MEGLTASFIGLGAMGFGMATHLLKKGYKVRGYDGYPPTLQRFKEAGGDTASSLTDCVKDAPFCICMVATSQQAQSLLFEGEKPMVQSLTQGATFLLCSTVACAYVRSLEAQLKEEGRGDIQLIDCPVSGGAVRAANGTLTIMAAGKQSALDRAKSLLQEISDEKKLFIVQGGVGQGSNMKMCHQVLASCQICSTSEAMGFASRLGLNLDVVREAIEKSDAWSWMYENRIPRMLDPDFKPLASAVAIILKDSGIITEEGRLADYPTPMVSTAEQVYLTALAKGYGGDDDSKIVRIYLDERQTSLVPSQGTSTDSEKIELVKNLLIGIHTCAAAEALCFAKQLKIDLDQFFALASDAAGGSAVFNRGAGKILLAALKKGELFAETTQSNGLAEMIANLKKAAQEARKVNCPLFLGTQALNQAMAAQRIFKGKEVETTAVACSWMS
ncbi:hypothetical protein MMC25_002936 [Agyrium rufum]|nr:hypothetical protein [Agyrium rufum]